MGRDEIQSMIEEGQAEVLCNFCNESYQFEVGELKGFVNEGK
jgi:molecular chaperone Hsp33